VDSRSHCPAGDRLDRGVHLPGRPRRPIRREGYDRRTWTVTDDVFPDWVGTRITWALTHGENGTAVRFGHLGFASTGGSFARIGYNWAWYLNSLKDYLETGKGRPGQLFRANRTLSTFVLMQRMLRDLPRFPSPAVAAAVTAWFEQLGPNLVARGNPANPSRQLGNCGAETESAGYQIVTAEDLEAAVAMAEGCPILMRGGGVEVRELTG
jgi:hypothetical protein